MTSVDQIFAALSDRLQLRCVLLLAGEEVSRRSAKSHR